MFNMNVGVIGSRGLYVSNLEDYIPKEITTLVSGGARGIDSCAENWAKENKIPTKIFLPQYEKYGRTAPLLRNITIVKNSDYILAFWDKKSRGTVFTLKKCKEFGVPFKVYIPSDYEEGYEEYTQEIY